MYGGNISGNTANNGGGFCQCANTSYVVAFNGKVKISGNKNTNTNADNNVRILISGFGVTITTFSKKRIQPNKIFK